MTKADRVLSTPPTNTSATNRPGPVDPTRRGFITLAAGASIVSVGSLAVAGIPTSEQDAGFPADPDPAFALIAEKLAADIAHCEAIDAQGEFDRRGDYSSDAAMETQDNSAAACDLVNDADWKLATTSPTTLAGVAAVLRFANEIEDAGMEWPATDTIGPEGWHYQLRATMAAVIEALIKARAGKAVA
jgi:hypothetical protein